MYGLGCTCEAPRWQATVAQEVLLKLQVPYEREREREDEEETYRDMPQKSGRQTKVVRGYDILDMCSRCVLDQVYTDWAWPVLDGYSKSLEPHYILILQRETTGRGRKTSMSLTRRWCPSLFAVILSQFAVPRAAFSDEPMPADMNMSCLKASGVTFTRSLCIGSLRCFAWKFDFQFSCCKTRNRA